jgi:hypothetical protein
VTMPLVLLWVGIPVLLLGGGYTIVASAAPATYAVVASRARRIRIRMYSSYFRMQYT